MRKPFPASQYFKMAEDIRAIAEQIEETGTRDMVFRIAEDYERMGKAADGPIDDEPGSHA